MVECGMGNTDGWEWPESCLHPNAGAVLKSIGLELPPGQKASPMRLGGDLMAPVIM